MVSLLIDVVNFLNFLIRMSSSDAVTSSGSGVVVVVAVLEVVTSFLNFSKADKDFGLLVVCRITGGTLNSESFSNFREPTLVFILIRFTGRRVVW